ncbi:MAG: DUF6851 domain-containing protein [Pseudomonadota bacterium]
MSSQRLGQGPTLRSETLMPSLRWRDLFVTGSRRDDALTIEEPVISVRTFRGDDDVDVNGWVNFIDLGRGDDTLLAAEPVGHVRAGRGNDTVALEADAKSVDMGRGDDQLTLNELIARADGGRGQDTLTLNFNTGDVDLAWQGNRLILTHRFSGEEMVVRRFETVEFIDRSFTKAELREAFGPDAEAPFISVADGTQALTVNDANATISVVWDRVVQQAVIETESFVGPTIASRAYAMMHTAMYDAWASYDPTALRVSFDQEGDNIAGSGGDAEKAKAMSFAAITILRDLFPDMEELYIQVMQERLGYAMEDDGSKAAQIGIDAAEDLLALRGDDGSNQANGYADTTGYTPVNPDPTEINDITRWTPENVPIDPEDDSPEQNFLTAQWLEVEGFGLAHNPDGSTDFSQTLPDAPQPFFTDAFADAVLNFADKTITLSSDATIGGVSYLAGDTIAVSQDLIGEVINQGFIDQAQHVIDISANLTDEQKIIAEFWEDGGGTAFPPGTFMSFAQFVSARDGNTLDQDAQLFFAMSNAVMDAGIATWQAKVEYDYVRPVRAIRDLGELGLLGEIGVDENTGETGYVITAFGGFNEDGSGRGTQTILAENFVTFQRPGADPSPPFAEYTSGHSAFSAAGAEVLRLFTGSDEFGGEVTFAPDSIQFEAGVPANEVTLSWDTFTEAADEAGFSRLYGGIHFTEGDLNGRTLGTEVGASAYELAQAFIEGTATDEDRPFYFDGLFA